MGANRWEERQPGNIVMQKTLSLKFITFFETCILEIPALRVVVGEKREGPESRSYLTGS